jgi:hypothetical protein
MNISKLVTEMDENADGDKGRLVPKKLSEGGRGGRATYGRNQTETRWNLTAEPDYDPSFFCRVVNPADTDDDRPSQGRDFEEDDSLASVDDEPQDIDIPGVDLVTEDMTFGNNILVPYEAFCSFMENFVCAGCHAPILELTKSSVGVATTILNVCSCGKKSSIKPKMVPPPQGQSENGNYRRWISVYALNV